MRPQIAMDWTPLHSSTNQTTRRIPALPKHSFGPFSQAACFYNATTIVGTMRHRHDRGGEGTVGVPPPFRQGRCLNSDEEVGKNDRRGGDKRKNDERKRALSSLCHPKRTFARDGRHRKQNLHHLRRYADRQSSSRHGGMQHSAQAT